jgi:hypothetical protein
MKPGWLPILLGGLFAGTVTAWLCADSVVFTLSAAEPQEAGVRPDGEEVEQQERAPVDEHKPARDLAKWPGVAVSLDRAPRTPLLGGQAPLRAERVHSEPGELDPGGKRLERVVRLARCRATSMLVVAPLLWPHGPPGRCAET